MRTVKQLTTNKFLNIKEVYDEEKHCRGYQFAERRGVDSIAFICWDGAQEKFLVNYEYTPPTDEFMLRAFGGSLDKAVSMKEIVIDEASEEAGYVVKDKHIMELGPVFVSTQMNQRCYLFLVDVTGLKCGERKPENQIEEMAATAWKTKEEIIDGDDWKAIAIICKANKIKGLFKNNLNICV